MKLFIGGPTRDTVPAEFAVSAAHLFAYTREAGPWGKNVAMDWIRSTYIHVGRELWLEAAIKQGATHVFWLDTDMVLPREAIVLMALHDQPVVACNYVARSPARKFTARMGDQGQTRIATTADSTGLEAVEYCGMGAMLMRTSVVEPLGRPWFRHGLSEIGGDVGEDVMFCRGLGRAGHTIWIDHDVSRLVEHIGQYRYPTVESAPVAV